MTLGVGRERSESIKFGFQEWSLCLALASRKPLGHRNTHLMALPELVAESVLPSAIRDFRQTKAGTLLANLCFVEFEPIFYLFHLGFVVECF
jgi:hypothetical protein